MNQAQVQAFEQQLAALKISFQKSRATAGTSGRARNWFVPYLVDVLRAYQSARNQAIGRRTLRRAIHKRRRTVFLRYLESSDRDAKTKSRWAAALSHAVKRKVAPEELPHWLAAGGGVAGRAAEYADSPVALVLDNPRGPASRRRSGGSAFLFKNSSWES